MAVERILVFAVALAAAIGAGALAQPEPSTPGPCSWVPLGPFAVPRGEGYDGTRVPVSGRVSALALDPGDPSIVYLGSALGGVWRSQDAGGTWLPVSDGEASLAIGALAVDPVQSGLVYAGTGEANLAFREQFVRDDRPLSGHRGRGVLKSTDGGRSWRLLGEQALQGLAFAEMAVSPRQPSLLLAATTGGLFRCLDRGESWSRLERGLPAAAPLAMATSVVFHPADPDVAYAAFWGKGVYRSDDVRSPAPAWKQLFGGLPLSNLSRIGLAVSAAEPDTLYALAATADSDLRGLYVSADGGGSWKAVPGTPDLLQGQGFFNLLLAAHPVQKGVLYLGGSGRRQEHPSSLYRGSRVNGQWRFIPLGGELHIDFHALVFDPRDPDVLFVGTDGGIWRTRDGGRTWDSRNPGLAT
ncbi:MAG: WD40/YVTN/BNR-like repeat-containing protein, partial [Thermoanaerobaculia bacterium]